MINAKKGEEIFNEIMEAIDRQKFVREQIVFCKLKFPVFAKFF
jgi:hypothetical protein